MHKMHLAALAVALFAGMGLHAIPTALTRKRKQADPSNKPTAPDFAATPTVVANKLRLTMPAPLSATGLPACTLTGGAHTGSELPTAKTQVSLLVWDLTYAHNVAAGDALVYPSKDPCFRNSNGGYVQPITKTL